MMARLNGTTIWHDHVGAGPPCLVLHGGLGVDHMLYRTLDPLGDTVELVFFDHRHNGRSGRPAIESVTIPQLADDAAALAAHLGHQRVAVLGHSYGGFVAQELALRHPDLVEALVLVDTTPGQLGATEDPDDDQGPPPPPDVAALFAQPPASPNETTAWFGRLFDAFLHQADDMPLRPLLDATIFDAAALAQGFVALSTWSSVDRLGTIACPTLVLVGRHDPATSWPQALRIARRIPTARAVIFEHSGHFPWIDEPEPVFDTLRAWLRHHMPDAETLATPRRPAGRATTPEDTKSS